MLKHLLFDKMKYEKTKIGTLKYFIVIVALLKIVRKKSAKSVACRLFEEIVEMVVVERLKEHEKCFS